MKKRFNIAVVGSTGAVGKEIITLLKKRDFPIEILSVFSSQNISNASFDNADIIFLAAGAAVSKEITYKLLASNARIIDLSSAFRMEEDVPLIMPEINPHLIQKNRLIASPNCVASLMALPLFPIHQKWGIERLVATAFQAASGGGKKLLQKLYADTKSTLSNETSKDPHFYGFNLFSHTSPLLDSGYVEEEKKIMDEMRKLISEPDLKISVTSIRVPVERAHSISVNIQCQEKISLEDVYNLLHQTKGVRIFEDRKNNLFASPRDAAGKEEVFCGRFRIDPSQPNTLEMWIVGDQLLKGAALNAVQIAEILKDEE